ncbi:MAG: Hint domain-containing protein, partial [Cypionkella sp.]
LIYGGLGNDLRYGGVGNDTLSGGADNDLVYGGDGNDNVYGDAGNDQVFGGAGNDLVDGGDGNDSVSGDAGNDTLFGGFGNDSLYGGDGADVLYGGDGGDFLDGGAGPDTLVGGAGADTIRAGIGDVIDGGTSGTDWDVLDLTGQAPFLILRDPLNPLNGIVNFLDAQGHVIGTLSFSNIESIVSCFTPGVRIATPKGEVAIEDLAVGDLVLTRDHGAQPIRWIGARRIGAAELARDPALRPVRIAAGALGPALPEAEMMVSRQHRMLISGQRAELLFGTDEVLVRAAHLLGLRGVDLAEVEEVTYMHILCDQHEVLLANGAWSESFQPGDLTLNGMDAEARAEIFKIFPELAENGPQARFAAARSTLRGFEARVLLAA